MEEPVEDIATACSNVHGGLTFQLEIHRLSKVLMIREVGGGKRLKRIKKKIIISCNQQTYSDYVKNKIYFCLITIFHVSGRGTGVKCVGVWVLVFLEHLRWCDRPAVGTPDCHTRGAGESTLGTRSHVTAERVA